jgi:hypothetical protein
MSYLIFTALFTIVHIIAYVLAGILALSFAKSAYNGDDRNFDFLRDMSDPEQKKKVGLLMLPSQLLRGVLMSLVLYPILDPLMSLSFVSCFVFFSGLAFVFTDFASAVPFPGNIEGYVYLKDKYRQKGGFFFSQGEMLIYSMLLGFAISFTLALI